MENKIERRDWTNDETILAFELYCTIPSNQVTVANLQVIAFANAIKRTPSSVKLKLQNFKSYDPDYTRNGRVGLNHGSKLDAEVSQKFYRNWDALVIEADQIKQRFKFGAPTTTTPVVEQHIPVGRDKTQLQKIRVGQTFFRQALLAVYEGKCCITGLAITELLRASHIKPWAQSNDVNEKTNPQNGLLLNALHDAAFDNGYITINREYKIVVSSKIGECVNKINRMFFTQYAGKSIAVPNKFKPAQEFIEYHNDIVFLR
ncbi:endonuclease [Planctomycetales bacterium]|nr:endonuclease [Planctomycetales bacterium]GHV20942.1 endonuclease [Planctomycetales bacterium]